MRWLGRMGALWGIVGVSLLLSMAVWRVGGYALNALEDYSLGPWHYALLSLWLPFMLVAEGYRGFQQKFSPRVAARAHYLATYPRLRFVLLAPFFCMGFFFATRKRLIIAYSLTTGIILLILLVRLLEQPWRGLIDLGVVAGLTWGLLSLWVFAVKTFWGNHQHDPEVPKN